MLDEDRLNRNNSNPWSLPQYNKNYQIFRAVVYDHANLKDLKNEGGDDRYQVRILPNMADVKDGKNFPCYPFLWYDHPYALVTEKENSKKADTVLVLATSDFTIGYILGGPITTSTGVKRSDVQSMSWPFQTLRDASKMIKLDDQADIANDITNHYHDLVVDSWSPKGNKAGENGHVICHNRKTGAMYWMCASGSFMSLGENYFVSYVGPLVQSSGQSYSAFSMTPSKVMIDTTGDIIFNHRGTIQLDCSGNAVVTSASVMPSNASGMSVQVNNRVLI